MSMSPCLTRQLYSTVLSALHKTDLIQLSSEFRLPTDGSIINLRNHLRCYLNFNCRMLAQNPRYATLFPKHRCTNQPLASRLSSNTLCMSPPALSFHTMIHPQHHHSLLGTALRMAISLIILHSHSSIFLFKPH